MNTCEIVRVQVHCNESVTEKMEAVYDRITQRAYERGLSKGVMGRLNMEFWAEAEQELIYKPETEVREWGHGVAVQIVCLNVEASSIRLFTSATELLVLAPMGVGTSDADRWLFRYLRFHKAIDHTDSSAEIENGVLRFEGTLLNAPDDEKVNIRVA